MVMFKKPYTETLKNGIKTRVFEPTILESDLKWHRDKNCRYVKIISGTNWKIQVENSLPITLVEGKTYYVNSKKWHRLIKGKDQLIIKIKEI